MKQMRAVAQIDAKQIDDMEMDITFRMKVSEWRRLMRDQSHVWPASDLGRHISAVLGHVTKATEMQFCDPLHAADPE